MRQGSTRLSFIFMIEINQYFLIQLDFRQNIINFKSTSRIIPKNMNGMINKFKAFPQSTADTFVCFLFKKSAEITALVDF